MTQRSHKLYTLVVIACAIGYVWLYYVYKAELANNKPVGVCFIKNITNIPCPSCGSTRSLISLIDGKLIESIYLNPFGLVIGAIMIAAPIWVLFDFILNRETLLFYYHKMESGLKKPFYAIPLIIFVIINWIWNIIKEL